MEIGEAIPDAVIKPAKAFALCGILRPENKDPVWQAAQKWIGEIHPAAVGQGDMFVFDTEDGKISEVAARAALAALAGGKHVYEFDPITLSFVRRDKAWLELPARNQSIDPDTHD